MRRRLPLRSVQAVLLAVACFGAASASHAQGVPFWQKALRWMSGDSAETTVPIRMGDPHTQLSVKRPLRPGDTERAQAIVETTREVLTRYADVADAERDGYLAFAPTGQIGEEVHYTSVRHGQREATRPDWSQPGSLLYRRTANGMKAVGVMMTAVNQAGPEDLDARAPLSIATWHRHVNFCGEPKGAPRSDVEGPTARFGFNGSIHTEKACQAAGGYWIPIAFGWMTHVYPNEKPAEVWGGEHMHPAGDGAGHKH